MATSTQIPSDVKSFELADLGKKRIDWANQSMKVLQIIRKEFIKNQPLKNLDPRMTDFRWMLEELRVSLFAQELRTPMPVSAKRLQKVWESMIR